MACELLKMATDDHVADSVKLAAIRDALDRAGLAAKNAVEVELGPPKPYEQILDSIMVLEGGSRAEYRRSRGISDGSDADQRRPSAADRSRQLPTAELRANRSRFVSYRPHRRIHRRPASG